MQGMQLDHIFMLIEPDGWQVAYLRSLGLCETYRRKHPGQGTQNICYCFENMFLELLWVDNAHDVRSESIARTGLYERSQGKALGTNPFGIAWRDAANDAAQGTVFSPPTWVFKPPYLPAGMHIEVAVDGDDHRQPMMFKSPGTSAPRDWPADKQGDLQRAAGLGPVTRVVHNMPAHSAPCATLLALQTDAMLQLGVSPIGAYELLLTVERLGQQPPLVLRLSTQDPAP
jgi:Glyoxalase-like domain